MEDNGSINIDIPDKTQERYCGIPVVNSFSFPVTAIHAIKLRYGSIFIKIPYDFISKVKNVCLNHCFQYLNAVTKVSSIKEPELGHFFTLWLKS